MPFSAPPVPRDEPPAGWEAVLRFLRSAGFRFALLFAGIFIGASALSLVLGILLLLTFTNFAPDVVLIIGVCVLVLAGVISPDGSAMEGSGQRAFLSLHSSRHTRSVGPRLLSPCNEKRSGASGTTT